MLVDINLLPEKERKHLPYILFLIFFLIVLAAAGFYMWQQYNSQLSVIQKLQTELANAKVEKVTMETKAKESNSNNAAAQLEAAVKWANDNQSSTYTLLQNISSLLPERGFIMNFDYKEDGSASLSVQFDSARQAAYYLKSLSNAAFVKQVDLLNIQAETVKSNTVVDDYKVLPRYTANYQLQVNLAKLKQKGEVTK